MEHYTKLRGLNFYVVGLSYKKADAHLRGLFSLDSSSQQLLLSQAKQEGIKGLITISTCNRTELYGFASHPFELIKLLCNNTNGSIDAFKKAAYIYKNTDAIAHIFNVGCGLDSQILGDCEIIGQLKTSAKQSKKHNVFNTFLDRLINAVIHASKRIKTETQISSGITSVSFASVQYILNQANLYSNAKILLYGTGKIGRNTCENLVKHTQNKNITLINRTKDKAEKIAGKFNLIVKDYSQLKKEIETSDILIVATGSQTPTIDKTLINPNKTLLVLDLSIPKNVHHNLTELQHITLVHLDDLSKVTDITLENRKKDIPKAKTIINTIQAEFINWIRSRKFAPTIKALKHKLIDFKNAELEVQRKKQPNFNEAQAELISNNIIQKITNQFAHHLKDDSFSSDESINLIKKVFRLEDSKPHA